jgi:hypothetical protein
MRYPPEVAPCRLPQQASSGVVLPLVAIVGDIQTQLMDRAPGAPIHALVVASAPLLRVGLERAVLAAGLQLTSDKAVAVIGLHTADTASTETGMDLSVGANQVTIALTAIPAPGTWSAVRALLAELLDSVSSSPDRA